MSQKFEIKFAHNVIRISYVGFYEALHSETDQIRREAS